MAANLSTKLTMDGTQHNDALRNATKELSKYKREVDNTDKQLKQFRNQSKSATGAVNTFAESFRTGNVKGMMIGAEGATKAFGDTLLKLGGWFGVAMGATEAFTKAIHSSQAAEDTFGTVQQQVTTVVDNFFTALTTGDFSSFLNGLDSITEKAKEAFQAMDDLWNMAQSFDVQNARLNNQFQKNLLEMRQLKGSKKPEDQQRYDKLKGDNEEIIKKQVKGGNKLYEQTIMTLSKRIQASSGTNINITEGLISKIVENDINDLENGRKRIATGYEKYRKGLERIQDKYAAQYNRQHRGGGLIDLAGHLNKEANYGEQYKKEIKQWQEQNSEFIVGNTLLFQYSDEELQKFNNDLKTGIAYQGQAIANASKMIRYNKETPTSGGSGSGGRSTTKYKPTKSEYPTGSVGWYDDQISAKQKQIKMSVDSSEIQRLKKEIEELKKEKDALENPITINIKPIEIPPMKLFDTEVEMPLIPKLTKQLDELEEKKNKATDVSQIRQINKEIEAVSQTLEKVKAGKDPMMPEINMPNLADQYRDIQDKIGNVLDGYDMGIIGAKKAQEFIDELNAQLESLGLKPIKIHVETDAEKSLSKIGDSAVQMGDAFSQLGESLAMPELDIAGLIAQTIGNIMLGYAQASAQSASMTPFGWLAFSIAGMAQVASVVAQIHSLSGYAEGGIIQGNRTIGDYNLARVNAGEMILTTRQQTNLFKMLDEGRTQLNQSAAGEVVFRIHGRDLEGVRRSYNDKMNKVR